MFLTSLVPYSLMEYCPYIKYIEAYGLSKMFMFININIFRWMKHTTMSLATLAPYRSLR